MDSLDTLKNMFNYFGDWHDALADFLTKAMISFLRGVRQPEISMFQPNFS